MIYREVTGLVTLKILRPYHIKVNEKYVHLRLENQFFTIYLNGEEYQFIPIEAKEIRVDRETKKIDNRSEEHTSELQSRGHLVCGLLLEKKNTPGIITRTPPE